MDSEKYMIIVKGKVKTSKLHYCLYNSVTKKWDLSYGDGKVYSYSEANIEYLENPKSLAPEFCRIRKGERTFFSIKRILVFEGKKRRYYSILFNDGSERVYPEEELEVVKSCLKDRASSNVFEYLKRIAALSNIKNEETGENILLKSFEKMGFIGEDTVLGEYLKPVFPKNKNEQKEYIPIFPFGCNNSQYMAVKNAIENKVSVIQGPPGTGKTQTILNIISNVLLKGKTVLIVSNNNSATLNVYEKLAAPEYGLDFLAAKLGSSDNKTSFIAKQAEYPDFSEWRIEGRSEDLLKEVNNKSVKLKIFFDKQELSARLRQELSQLETELEYFKEYAGKIWNKENKAEIKNNLTSKKLIQLWRELEITYEKNQKIGILFKLKAFIKYGLFNIDIYKKDFANLIAAIQEKYYEKRKNELEKEVEELQIYINNSKDKLLDELCTQSMRILKAYLANKYGKKKKRTVFCSEDLWKNPRRFLEEYPIILSTTFSSRNSLSREIIYDYLVMDEASQVDITTGALALSCARNAIIVGDTKQLPNVLTKEDKKRSDEIFKTYKIDEAYRFTKSFLESVIERMPYIPQVLLKEHYRCHPKIINFCNQKFYKGELIVMTKDEGEKDVLTVIKTAKGNHSREHYSQRQIDVIKAEALPGVKNRKETGIIAPYKNQAEALRKEFSDIESATVHKFQGREKETIIISTVDDEISDFADDPYLINVAISRAKKRLILVVSGNEQKADRNISDLISYIQYNNFELIESKVYSIFDYLYKQYTKERRLYLSRNKKISLYDSENLMYVLIKNIMSKEKYSNFDFICHFPLNMVIKDYSFLNEREKAYVLHPNTHVDFLIYYRISKKPALALEVDGYAFHKDGSGQAVRDELKNRILSLYKIPLLRFKTTGSSEEEILTKTLDNLS
jgi:hypothetical protein